MKGSTGLLTTSLRKYDHGILTLYKDKYNKNVVVIIIIMLQRHCKERQTSAKTLHALTLSVRFDILYHLKIRYHSL